ncbi:MAG TPA: hypothetical protein VGF13_17725, partial [Verrucomicrobiae bacterium]
GSGFPEGVEKPRLLARDVRFSVQSVSRFAFCPALFLKMIFFLRTSLTIEEYFLGSVPEFTSPGEIVRAVYREPIPTCVVSLFSHRFQTIKEKVIQYENENLD